MSNSFVLSVLSSASSVGFCGSRSFVPPLAVSSFCFDAVVPSASVAVGCARGSDALVRSFFPGASVFSVSAFGVGRGAFARRSVAFVRSLSASPSPLLVSFPASACPAGLLPSASASACFCGLGSGSWASVALAVGLGVSVLVWVPAGVPCPVGFDFVAVGGGWFFSVSLLLF